MALPCPRNSEANFANRRAKSRYVQSRSRPVPLPAIRVPSRAQWRNTLQFSSTLLTWFVTTTTTLTVAAVDTATDRPHFPWLCSDFSSSMCAYGSRSLINLTYLPSCHVSIYFHPLESPPYNSSTRDGDNETVTKSPHTGSLPLRDILSAFS